MRIGIDAHMLGDRSGGNESFYRGILSGIDPDPGDEYYIFVRPGVDASEYQDRYHVVYFKSGSSIYRNCIELSKLCREYKIDVLHTQYYLPILCPCKSVVTIHDLSFEHIKDIFTKKEYIKDKLLVSHAARKADTVVTVSDFSKQDIIDTYKVDASKIEVIYNAVGPEFCELPSQDERRGAVRAEFGLSDDKYLLCVGNLQPRKNIPRLIMAFDKYIKDNNADCKLVIVGKKAWMYEEIEKYVSDNKDKVILTDYVSTKVLVELLNEAKGFIYPSIFEGFGIPPLEALCCGTPVAASDIPVIREVLGDNIVYFDPFNVDDMASAIRTLMEGDCSVDSVIIGRYSWEKSADKLKEVYHKTYAGELG